jgi:hypothetical protein
MWAAPSAQMGTEPTYAGDEIRTGLSLRSSKVFVCTPYGSNLHTLPHEGNPVDAQTVKPGLCHLEK